MSKTSAESGVVELDEGLLAEMRKVDKPAAVMMAVGAASMCWENPGGAGVYDSSAATRIGATLAAYLNTPGGIATADAAWLLVLVQNAIPRNADDPASNWEGLGREHAYEILRAAMEGGRSHVENTVEALGREIERYRDLGMTSIPLDMLELYL